jgi:hypothetical protein
MKQYAEGQLCTNCHKEIDPKSVVKQLLIRRDGAEQIFCDQGCRNEWESAARDGK